LMLCKTGTMQSKWRREIITKINNWDRMLSEKRKKINPRDSLN
jgi:hypothetical protein